MSIYPNGAEKANRALDAQRLAYDSTTKPLNSINDSLKDIKILLQDLLELLKKRV